MQQVEQARLEWQRAQADVRSAQAELEKLVAEFADGAVLDVASKAVADRQRVAEEMLQRYITQIGKS